MYMDIAGRRQPQNWVHRKQIPITDKGQPAEVTGFARRAEDQLKARAPEPSYPLSYDETQRLLKELQALKVANAELEAFNAAVSHDLCTPLTTINGYCQVLTELCSAQLDEQSKQFLHGIYAGTLRMKQLISSMLEFSRNTQVAAARETVDVSEVAKAVAAELKLAAPKRRVSFRIAEGITGNGDPGLWRSVLDNLLGNAWKYSAGREKTVIDFGTADVAGRRVCFVRDNGPGFDMTFADQLFLPFKRIAGADVAGNGIGLATVDRIVKRHGGRIWAESKPGKGATFFFTMQ